MINMQGLSKRKKAIVAIEIDRDYLKIAQTQTQGKGIIITKLITEPITGFSDNEISKALVDVVHANSISLSSSVVAIVPREKAMVRYIRLPSTDPSEIDNMISFEVAKQVPYSKEEVITDYEIIDTTDEGYSEIMLVVTHKNELERINKIFTATGYQPQNIRLSSEAIWRWLMLAVSPDKLMSKDVCLIDIDADTTEIVIVANGKLAFSRVANIGAANISLNTEESGHRKDQLIDEIKRSIATYLKEKGRDASIIPEFIITGSNSVLEDFRNLLIAQTQASCEIINMLSTLSLADGAMTEKGITPSGSVCVVCGSLFITDGINLISEGLRKSQRRRIKLNRAIGISISLAVVLLLIIAAISSRIYHKQKLLKQLQGMLVEINNAAGDTEEKLKKLKVLKQQSSEGASSLDAIYNLYKLIPSNISLVDFEYDDSTKVVRFRGRAINMSDVFKLATILEGSDRFSNVQTRSVTKRQVQKSEVVDFQIWCNFSAQGEK